MAVIYTLWCMTAICYTLLKGQLETLRNLGQLRWLHQRKRLLTARSPAISVRADLLIGADRTRFSACPRGGSAATGSGRAYGTALPFLHTHVHERAVGGRREAVSCFCTGMRRGGRPGELNQLKNENVAGELSHFFVLSSRENYSWTL